jgi:hypothetical protein
MGVTLLDTFNRTEMSHVEIILPERKTETPPYTLPSFM